MESKICGVNYASDLSVRFSLHRIPTGFSTSFKSPGPLGTTLVGFIHFGFTRLLDYQPLCILTTCLRVNVANSIVYWVRKSQGGTTDGKEYQSGSSAKERIIKKTI